jgi:hypothetical protein
MSTVENTKSAIVGRIHRDTVSVPVAEHAIKFFDYVISEVEADAMAAHPKDKWARVNYWKKEILSRVADNWRGLVAIQFHEYMAALERGDEETTESLLSALRPSNPFAEQIALRDAHLATSASLA